MLYNNFYSNPKKTNWFKTLVWCHSIRCENKSHLNWEGTQARTTSVWIRKSWPQKSMLVMFLWVLRLRGGPKILCWLVRGCQCWGSSLASLESHLYRAPGLHGVPPPSEASSQKRMQTCWCTQIYGVGEAYFEIRSCIHIPQDFIRLNFEYKDYTYWGHFICLTLLYSQYCAKVPSHMHALYIWFPRSQTFCNFFFNFIRWIYQKIPKITVWQA